jgi:F-type H+-transporting ATPase subunit a
MLAALSPFEHVLDTNEWHIFEAWNIGIHLPRIFGLQITKFMVLQVIAAGVIIAIFVPIARRAKDGSPPRGPFWNAFEKLLTFIRDDVAKPAIGHDADRYVPMLWTIFLYVLMCNLLGMFPFMGSPTASISVTGALAVIAFFLIHGSAVAKMGPFHYLKSYVPHIEVPFAVGIFLIPMIIFIEVFGNFIKATVLAVRLFANMLGGHTVLAVILLFIVMVKDQAWYLFLPITAVSVLGVVALSLLELFVAFLQAYIFTFLTSLFLGMTLHPEH